MKKLSPRIMLFFAALLCFLPFFSCTTPLQPIPTFESSSSEDSWTSPSSSSDGGIWLQSSSSAGGGSPVKPPQNCFGENDIVNCCFNEGCRQIEYSLCYFGEGIIMSTCP